MLAESAPPPVWIGLTSQLVYILCPLQSSPEAIKESNTFFLQIVCFFNIRINKVYEIKRNVMIKDNSQGGMKMIHLASFNKSISRDWFKNQPGFKITLTLEMVVVGKLSLMQNSKDMEEKWLFRKSQPKGRAQRRKGIRSFCGRNSLEIWSQISFEETVSGDKHRRSLPLWHNSLIRIGKKLLLYKDWFLKGISKVNHLMADSFNFLSLTSFQNKYNFRVQPLTFLEWL